MPCSLLPLTYGKVTYRNPGSLKEKTTTNQQGRIGRPHSHGQPYSFNERCVALLPPSLLCVPSALQRLQQLRQRVAIHNPGSDTTCGKVVGLATVK
ncbi:UNVERIFIED_CONTAM: hypothetical protein FKN15_000489 [Acipenser sinensis]